MLQQLEQIESVPYALVLTPSSERVFQLRIEYERSNMCMPTIKVAAVCDGSPIDKDDEVLETITSHIIVGTPNRVLGLIRNNKLDLKNIKHFVLDDCNKMLKQLDVLGKVHDILRNTPYGKHSIIFPDSRHIGVRPVYERIKSTITSLNTISITFPTTTAPITPDAAPQIVNNSSKCCCCIDMNCFSITQSCVCNWTGIIEKLRIVFCLVLVVVCFRYLFEQTTTK
uniref:Helicase ATP-binding domain-containing protein n=1 Tax=Anopheles maculatus TaxID=74869 RepID=A0A182SLR4_9DIPT